MIANHNNIKIILFLSIPFALITGPFLPDLFVSILGIYFFFNKKKDDYIKYFLIIFLIFYTIIVLSSFFSENFLISIQTSLPYIRFCFFVLTSSLLIISFPKIKIYFLNILIFCFLILVIDGYIQFITGKNIFNYSSQNARISSFFGDELILGSYIARLLPISIAIFFLIYNQIKYKSFYYIVFFFTFSLIIISGERTSFALFTIFLISSIFFCNIKKKIKFSVIFSFILISFLMILNFPSIKNRFLTETIQEITGKNDSVLIKDHDSNGNLIYKTKDLLQMQNKIKNNNIFFFSTAHESAIRISLKMNESSPIFGIGPKIFRHKCNDNQFKVYERGCSTHPHNYYAQILAETGLMGFIFICSLYLLMLASCFCNMFLFKEKKLNIYQIILISIFISFLFPLLPTGNFFNNWLSITFYLPMPFLIASFYEN